VTGEALLARIREAPDQRGARLVYADWLSAQGDPRGELIVLDEREREAGLDEPGSLERLLRLAAEHGFPLLPEDPDERLLPWWGGGSYPVQYDVDHGGRHYYLRYRGGYFSIDVDDVEVAAPELHVVGDGDWTDTETNMILTIVSDAIVSGAPLDRLVFPARMEMHRHPGYRLGRFPQYVLPEELLAAHGVDWRSWLLRARDRDRWYRLWKRLQHLVRSAR
jgi:uncharacterized protein (TIGR02996 family)